MIEPVMHHEWPTLPSVPVKHSHRQLQPPHFEGARMGSCYAISYASIADLWERSPRISPNRHVPVHPLASEWLLRHLGLEATSDYPGQATL